MSPLVRLLAFAIVLSAVLRIGVALYQGPEIVARLGVTDEVSYHTLAVRVIDGHGFSFPTGWWPATRANQPTAHWSFLYVLFLAAVYTVAGPAPLVARLVQASIVGIAHPWLVWRIANRLFGARVGVAASLLTAVYGYFVYYAGALVTESLYIVAVLWVIDIATSMTDPAATPDRARGLKPWLMLGFAAGIATLLRQAFLLMVPIVVAWVAWQILRRQRGAASPVALLTLAGRAAAAVAVVIALMLPWTVRNYNAFGQFVPLNTNAGFVMFWANHPVHGNWFIPILSYGTVNYGTMLPRELAGMSEAAIDRELLKRGMGFVAEDPIRYIRLSMSRTVEFFKFWPSADSSLGSNAARVLSFGLLLPLLVSGMLMAFRQWRRDPRPAPGASLLVIVAAAYTLVHLLTWTLVRYRLPVDAIVMPFAGVSLAAAWSALRGLTPIRLLAPAVGRADDQPTTSTRW